MNVNELSSIFTERFENRRNNLKIALFLGAGADISSGGISFSQFKTKFCEKYSDQPILKGTPIDIIDDRFNSLLQSDIESHNRGHIVDQLFREFGALEPSDSYKVLALLAQKKVIDAVITTNFDTMLERAAHSVGVSIFQIFSPGISKPYDFDDNIKTESIPYIKLHGDLSARSELVLTQQEISEGKYDQDILKLFKKILNTYQLVFAGYSGYDYKISDIISRNIKGDSSIYFCNPNKLDDKSPLSLKLQNKNVRFIKTTFDSLIENIAKPILKRPSTFKHSPTLIKSLLIWRLEYFQNQFYNEHLSKTFLKVNNRPIPRQQAESKVRAFLLSELPLLIISGKSGIGKSILGINACNWSKKQGNNLFFFINAKSLDKPELDTYIVESLGGIGSEAASTLFNIENWFEANNYQLIIFLDGLNEFSSSIESCVNLFRNVLRLLIQLKPQSPIKVIITIREEIWHKVYHYVDQFFLNQILARENNGEKAYSIINLDRFNNEEFNEALKRLSNTDFSILDKAGILTGYDQLRDPFFLNVIYNHTNNIDEKQSFFKIFEFSIQEKLSQCSGVIHPVILTGILSNIAFHCLNTNKSFVFREFCNQQNVDVLEDILQDLGLFSRNEIGKFRFSHDRLHEYFLSKAFGFADVPDISNVETLQRFIVKYQDDAIAIAAARMYFILNEEYIHSIEEGFLKCSNKDSVFQNNNTEIFFSFIKDVLIELADDNPFLLSSILSNLLHDSRIGDLQEYQVRSLILIIVHLPHKIGIELFKQIIYLREDLSSIESEIFLMDYIIEYYCNSNRVVNLIEDEPFSTYFNDPKIPNWKRITRFFSFIGRLGPFNLNPEEYIKLKSELTDFSSFFFLTNKLSIKECNDFADYVLKFCNRLFFNASKKEVELFFKNEKKLIFISIFEHLENGGTIDQNIYSKFKPYITRIGNNSEFHLCKLAFILSSKNDFEKTMDFWKEAFQSFDGSTPPEEVDFLQATLLYLFVVNEIPYSENYDKYFEKVLQNWPTILSYSPGLIRSQWRNMEDDFDKVFEDGFNPIASYIYLRPVELRRSLDYDHYKQLDDFQSFNSGSLYITYLNEFLNNGEIHKALRIIHAICSHIMLWPQDGFSYLPLISNSQNSLIRRAYIRVLAESYHRFPLHTLDYLRDYGLNLSDDEIRKIKIRIDPQIGYRQIEDLEWANIVHFFMSSDTMPKSVFYKVLKEVIMSSSLHEAIYKIFSFADLIKF